MFPVGGIGVMVLGSAVSGIVLLALAIGLSRRHGWVTSWAGWGFVWSVIVIGLVTLIPTNPNPGVVPAEGRATTCSFDIGGPAPDGFWIFDGGQRLLNTALFVPAGALLALWLIRWRGGWLLLPFGLAGLAAYSVGIELTQLELARIDRACDVTDIIDNTSGAMFGIGAGIVLGLVLRPWRERRRH